MIHIMEVQGFQDSKRPSPDVQVVFKPLLWDKTSHVAKPDSGGGEIDSIS